MIRRGRFLKILEYKLLIFFVWGCRRPGGSRMIIHHAPCHPITLTTPKPYRFSPDSNFSVFFSKKKHPISDFLATSGQLVKTKQKKVNTLTIFPSSIVVNRNHDTAPLLKGLTPRGVRGREKKHFFFRQPERREFF